MPFYFVVGAVLFVVGGIALHFRAVKTAVPLGTLKIGDKVIVDTGPAGFGSLFDGEAVFKLTEVAAKPFPFSPSHPEAEGTTLRGVSLDPRLPMSPNGLGGFPVPIALRAVVGRAEGV